MSTGTGAVSRRKTGIIAGLCVLLAARCGTAKPENRAQAAQSIDQAQVTGYVSSFPSRTEG